MRYSTERFCKLCQRTSRDLHSKADLATEGTKRLSKRRLRAGDAY